MWMLQCDIHEYFIDSIPVIAGARFFPYRVIN